MPRSLNIKSAICSLLLLFVTQLQYQVNAPPKPTISCLTSVGLTVMVIPSSTGGVGGTTGAGSGSPPPQENKLVIYSTQSIVNVLFVIFIECFVFKSSAIRFILSFFNLTPQFVSDSFLFHSPHEN